jgi:hypothetical protein
MYASRFRTPPPADVMSQSSEPAERGVPRQIHSDLARLAQHVTSISDQTLETSPLTKT